MILVPEYEADMKGVSDEAGITLPLLVLTASLECPVHQFGLHRAGIQVVCTGMHGRALLLPIRQRFICLTAEQTPFCATTGSACPLASEKWNQAVNSSHLSTFRHSAHKMPSPLFFAPSDGPPPGLAGRLIVESCASPAPFSTSFYMFMYFLNYYTLHE